MNVLATQLTSSKLSGVQRILLAEILRLNLLEIFPDYRIYREKYMKQIKGIL